MYVLYDTSTVHPLDRYDYYRRGAASELAPVAIHGRSPDNLLAVMSVAKIGDFTVESVTYAADSEVVALRTDHLIRVCDPECYRIFLSVNGEVRMEQAGNQVPFGARDIAFFDMSLPWQTTHPTGPEMKVIMLTFPRALIPIPHATVRPIVGTVVPRSLPGRSLIAQFLIELTDTAMTTEQVGDPGLVDLLHECAVGLIRQRLGLPDGITPRIIQLLHMARVQDIIRRNLDNPELDPDQIAKEATISLRHMHKIFQGAELTPMRLLKRLRLEECRRCLQDPAQAMTPIKDIIFAHGYRRSDQFARDFKQLFGVPANQVRRMAGQQLSGA